MGFMLHQIGDVKSLDYAAFFYESALRFDRNAGNALHGLGLVRCHQLNLLPKK